MLRTERNNNDALLPYGSSVKRQKNVEVVFLLFLNWYLYSSDFLQSLSHECWNYHLLLCIGSIWTPKMLVTKTNFILNITKFPWGIAASMHNFLSNILCAAAIINIRLQTPAWTGAYWNERTKASAGPCTRFLWR